MKLSPLSRRQLIRNSIVGAAGLVASRSALAEIAAACGITPPQTEGPFYPVEDQRDKDTDLTFVEGRTGRAKGQVIFISGRVEEADTCLPVPNALVEIWQACASGRYHHPGDTSGLPLDPNFQYWGRTTTDGEGRYSFKTVIPGHYPADANWERPPHIHYKAYARGYRDLTTQMYFDPTAFDFDPTITPEYIGRLNALDAILQDVPKAEQSRVIVKLTPASELERGAKQGNFDLVLQKVRR